MYTTAFDVYLSNGNSERNATLSGVQITKILAAIATKKMDNKY